MHAGNLMHGTHGRGGGGGGAGGTVLAWAGGGEDVVRDVVQRQLRLGNRVLRREDDDVVVDEATDALLLLFIVSPPPCEDDNIATFEATLLLRPKPHNFTSPCSDNKALLGFTSQCNNPAPCNARKPLHKSTANRRIDDSGNLPSCFKTFNSVPPTQYSKTNHKWFLVSYHATNFNARSCLIALNACTSCKTL